MAKASKASESILGGSTFARFMEREMLQLYARHSRWDVWRSFISWGLAALQQDDDRRRDLEGRMPDMLPTWERWAKAIGEAIRLDPYMDHLGTAYMAIGQSNKDMAQYFSSSDIAELMASVTIPEKEEESGPLLTALEPTCGSGVMILATEKIRRARGLRPLVFCAMDLDRHCCELTALQCGLHDIPVLVIHCNTLLFGLPGHEGTLISPRIRTQIRDEEPVRITEVKDKGMMHRLLREIQKDASRAWEKRKALQEKAG